MKNVTALYPGTFDPATNGHVDVVRRAAYLFSKLIVAVYAGTHKEVMFNVQDRIEMLEEALDNTSNVSVMPYHGLTVEFARQTGASAIVRGLRISSDFEYEGALALMNRHLDPGIETVCLFSSIENQYVSSSRVKEIAALGGDISGLVPKNVASAIQHTLDKG